MSAKRTDRIFRQFAQLEVKVCPACIGTSVIISGILAGFVASMILLGGGQIVSLLPGMVNVTWPFRAVGCNCSETQILDSNRKLK